jgi:hypothetical protein
MDPPTQPLLPSASPMVNKLQVRARIGLFTAIVIMLVIVVAGAVFAAKSGGDTTKRNAGLTLIGVGIVVGAVVGVPSFLVMRSKAGAKTALVGADNLNY